MAGPEVFPIDLNASVPRKPRDVGASIGWVWIGVTGDHRLSHERMTLQPKWLFGSIPQRFEPRKRVTIAQIAVRANANVEIAKLPQLTVAQCRNQLVTRDARIWNSRERCLRECGRNRSEYGHAVDRLGRRASITGHAIVGPRTAAGHRRRRVERLGAR